MMIPEGQQFAVKGGIPNIQIIDDHIEASEIRLTENPTMIKKKTTLEKSA